MLSALSSSPSATVWSPPPRGRCVFSYNKAHLRKKLGILYIRKIGKDRVGGLGHWAIPVIPARRGAIHLCETVHSSLVIGEKRCRGDKALCAHTAAHAAAFISPSYHASDTSPPPTGDAPRRRTVSSASNSTRRRFMSRRSFATEPCVRARFMFCAAQSGTGQTLDRSALGVSPSAAKAKFSTPRFAVFSSNKL